MRWDLDIKTTVGAVLLSGRRITVDELRVLCSARPQTIRNNLTLLSKEGWNIESVWKPYRVLDRTKRRKIYWLSGTTEPDIVENKGDNPYFSQDKDVYNHVEDLHLKRRFYWRNPANGIYGDMFVSLKSYSWGALERSGKVIRGKLSDDYVRALINVLEYYGVRQLTIEAPGVNLNPYFLRYCALKCIAVCRR